MTLLISAAVISFAGCLSDATPVDLEGTFTLRTVNGTGLPYTISNAGGTKVELIEGSVSLYQGNTYSSSSKVRTTTNGQATVANSTDAGSFTFEFNNLKLRSATGGAERIANLDGRSFTIVEIGTSYFYSR